MASRQVPLDDPASIPVPVNADQAGVMRVIEQALSARDWRIVKHVAGDKLPPGIFTDGIDGDESRPG